jgi:hypothetical protein
VTDDVEDVAVRVANEESAVTPWLLGQRVHDLITPTVRFFVGFLDTVPT